MKCPYCGGDVNPGAAFCSNCGARLTPANPQQMANRPAQDQNPYHQRPTPYQQQGYQQNRQQPGQNPYQKSAYQAGQQQNAYQSTPNQSYQPSPVPSSGGEKLKDDRSLLMYILLDIITCGFYSFFFLHGLARDVNTICEGDGKETAGLLKFILLTMITCGIYAWIWYYGIGNRLAENAGRYGMSFSENGTTVLMWMLFGSLLCGIGPFIAFHIIISNTNRLASAYNVSHGLSM